MFIWRYGILSEKSDLTELDQWISESTIKEEMPDAPAALREALETFIFNMTMRDPFEKFIFDITIGVITQCSS